MKFLLLFFFGLAFANECFEYDTDYDGTNLNNGLQQKTSTAQDCWQLCKLTLGCEGFTWASSNFPDDDYKNACWLKKDVVDKYRKSEAVSGPRECIPSSPCCANLEFVSDGSLAAGGQNHVLGNYGRLSDGPGDKWNYQQNSGSKRKLWYNPSLRYWFIGDHLGTNEGYALASGTAQCPENLGNSWEWYDFEDTGDWAPDTTAKFQCRDVTNPPTPDSCLTGSDCDGCGLTVEWNGQTYCCNNYCDLGWINVDPNTDPLCQCGHD